MLKEILKFCKNHYEIFAANFIILGVIAFTLLAQFGVHIRVDKDVDLVPVEIGYSQSTIHINSKFVHVPERYVNLQYKDNAQKWFWMPAAVVFGRAGEDEIKDMIKDGGPIKRNVFFNTRTNEVIGVTKSGRSVLSLYYHNSNFFRNGIWILIIVDIFVALVIKITNK